MSDEIQVVSIDKTIPILKHKVSNHRLIKQLILNAIKKMGTYSFINNYQRITNTDWHLSNEFDRPYYEYVSPIIDNVRNEVSQYFKYNEDKITLTNCWFQQYAKNDYHLWHSHGRSTFSCVYYVSLSDDNPKTLFRIGADEFSVEVKEGEILTFPSFLEHVSKENTSDLIKTVVAFNLTSSD